MTEHAFSSIHDFTAEAVLLLRSALDVLDEAIIMADQTGRIVAWNKTAARLIGLPVDASPEAWNEAFGIFLPDERTPCPAEAVPLWRALQGERVDDVELYVKNPRMPQGVHVFVSARPIPGEQGRVRGGIVVFQDATFPRLAQVARRHGETRLRAIVANTPNVAIEGYDMQGRVLYWNRAAERLFGWSEEEVVGKTLDGMMLDTPSTQKFVETLEEIARTGKPNGPNEWSCHRKDGSEVWVYSTIFAIPTIAGACEFVCMDVDVTPLKLAEDRIREQAKQMEAQAIGNANLFHEALQAISARDDFLAVASHELRTPLTPLKLQLERLVRDARAGVSQERMAPALEVAYRQVGRLAALIDRLLDVSRITAGKLDLCLDEVDLCALVHDVVTRFGREAEDAGCLVAFHHDKPIWGTWDRLRIEQVVTNLLGNALKYGRGKPIEIELEADEGTARLTVRDHGVGIAPEDQGKIFERFERAVSNQSFGGLGLGLWIVRQIVETHGGTVRVESAPGVGSTFRVELPRRGKSLDESHGTISIAPGT
ncbi:sensor histidine kinase [Polyangium jinanense]|uniref:histidine kinase n=1 Tax=Polyangium jinanense TaxID=2829994 RepID=A0A9X3WZV2_9BACT|nr:ATP-binding protein [Polyangium jinanense]MDC3953096.1 PAS domain S-box protein [Polyangium jinanense]MDC3979783.1 PAS domain S-box protein [Polyangium jinanense]